MSFNIKTIGNDGIVGNHPDVTNWLNTISLVGGSASSTTISALNTFCNSIDAAGLRNKFYRLNLFCGNNLASCLVPLYVNTVWNLPVLGFSVDTNFNFVAADYVESGSTGGLKGNGSNKGLLTGLKQSMIGFLYNIHCSTYFETSDGSSATMRYCGCFATNHTLMNETSSNTIGGRVGDNFYFSGTLSASPAGNQGGHHITSRTLQNDARHFRNGVSIVQRTDSITATTETSQQYGVFGAATDNIGGFNSLTSRRLRSYSFGLGFSASEALAYYNALQTFQTSLGRNV